MRLFSALLVLVFCFSTQAYDHKILKMMPPKAKKQFDNQVKRMDQLRHYKVAGSIGESETGLIAIREIRGVKIKDYDIVKKLVDEENKDRLVIYKEIVALNKLSKAEHEMLIKNSFEVWRNTDAKGTYFFEKGLWQQHY